MKVIYVDKLKYEGRLPKGEPTLILMPFPQPAANPAKRIAAGSEEIPRPAQFSAQRAGNGAVRGISELVRVVGLEPTRLTA